MQLHVFFTIKSVQAETVLRNLVKIFYMYVFDELWFGIPCTGSAQ